MMSTPTKRRSQMTSDGHDLEAGPDASRVGSGKRHSPGPLSLEEKTTYHRWMCGTLVLYGAVAVVLGGLVFTGSSSTPIPALEKGAVHARLAPGSK
jgi:hypothetical protein